MTDLWQSVLHQDNSWCSLNADLPDFRKILTAHQIAPNFLEAIVSFGSKVTGDDDPYFEYCESRRPSDENDDTSGMAINEGSSSTFPSSTGRLMIDCGTECSYLLRTYERHGRSNLKDPWSLRQMAVFHKYEPRNSRSVWILLQPFHRAKYVFLKAFSEEPMSKYPQALHHIFLAMTMPNWRLYLNHRRRMVSRFVRCPPPPPLLNVKISCSESILTPALLLDGKGCELE